MLQLTRHLTESELLVLRDRPTEDWAHRMHLESCPRCQKRFSFLSAFRAALKESSRGIPPGFRRRERSPDRLANGRFAPKIRPQMFAHPDFQGPETHPDPVELAAFLDGALIERERDRVQAHVDHCERCMADVLSLSPDSQESGSEDVLAARDYFKEHGTSIHYRPNTRRVTRPQLVLGLVDEPGRRVLFQVLERPSPTGRLSSGRPYLDERVEVMVGMTRVTVTAHRDTQSRYLDVLVREVGPHETGNKVTASLEANGDPIASFRTTARGTASLEVPSAMPEFDLRVDGGWMIPILLRFRA